MLRFHIMLQTYLCSILTIHSWHPSSFTPARAALTTGRAKATSFNYQNPIVVKGYGHCHQVTAEPMYASQMLQAGPVVGTDSMHDDCVSPVSQSDNHIAASLSHSACIHIQYTWYQKLLACWCQCHDRSLHSQHHHHHALLCMLT